ncbi:hypothetical protein BCR39DRAFT_538187 [Naematelia encephala]|uniref:DNA replication regulator SLD2 n=1 Tax=Naematelia encephala TaxID=71784 RepID=A0A1Y2AYB7_9TREE|nr:hypothetical protein BCR39DRAFT_538187 [Naematelia encephala]
MDLPAIRTAVKSWEKTFKSQYGRDPTKDDIKQDPSGIAKQYALYRQLSKASGSSSQSQSHRLPSSSSAASRSSNGESSRPTTTPRVRPMNEHPTTPTPPARRRSSAAESIADIPSRNLKRTASKAALQPHPSSPPSLLSSSRPSFITPKKPRPSYSGPVVDPNPLNPFASPSKSATKSIEATSPFIHASSPRKLKEVIQANSLRKVRERESAKAEITPRTRARKRLKGEWVEDTPIKDKAPRRRRGEGRSVVDQGDDGFGREASIRGRMKMIEEDRLAVEAESDDELGPSPVKRPAGMLRAFTELLGESDRPVVKLNGVSDAQRQPSREKSGRLDSLGGSSKDEQGKERAEAVRSISQESGVSPSHPGQPEHRISIAPPSPPVEVLPPPSPDPEIETAISIPTPSRSQARTKVLSLSDDEIDEWDPEAGPIRHRVVITGTRRVPAVRRSSSDEYDEVSASEDGDENDQDHDHDRDLEEAPPPLVEGTTATSPSSPSSASLAPPLMSVLSLHSPSRKKQGQLNDLRVKAIFNPRDATRLKALRKGQEIYVSGEIDNAAEEEDVIGLYEVGMVAESLGDEAREGDDDWDSENEGWKRDTAGLGLDDDDGW